MGVKDERGFCRPRVRTAVPLPQCVARRVHVAAGIVCRPRGRSQPLHVAASRYTWSQPAVTRGWRVTCTWPLCLDLPSPRSVRGLRTHFNLALPFTSVHVSSAAHGRRRAPPARVRVLVHARRVPFRRPAVWEGPPFLSLPLLSNYCAVYVSQAFSPSN